MYFFSCVPFFSFCNNSMKAGKRKYPTINRAGGKCSTLKTGVMAQEVIVV